MNPAHRLTALLLALSAALLGGCATSQYDIQVRALAVSPATPTGSYRLINEPTDPAARPPYEQAARFVRRALAGKGLQEASLGTDADWRVELKSGLGSPRTQQVENTRPLYVTVPGRIYYETVQVGVSATGAPIYSTIARQDPPTQQIAGYEHYYDSVTSYTKYLQLRAFPGRAPAPGPSAEKEIWAVQASVHDETASLAKSLPALATATALYAGKHLPRGDVIHLKDRDGDVALVRNGK